MNSSLTNRDLTLSDILRLIDLGALGLPDFQRPFSWEADRVKSLLATVFMGWPAGLILLMEAPPKNFFAVRSLEGLNHDSNQFRHLILDGQQRVTALAHAFGVTGSSRQPVWYVNIAELEKKLDTGELEDAFVRRMSPASFSFAEPLVPVSAFRDASEFQKWRNGYLTPSIVDSGPKDNAMFDRVNRLWVERLARISRFNFPCTIVPADLPLRSVAMIFEKLNTAGMQLDTFDLVVAHVYKDGRNLRNAWDREVEQRPILRRFAPSDPLVAAELVAMVHKGDTRRSGLLNLEADLLWNCWSKAVSAIESAARFLIDQAGINESKQLPHRGILLALAGLAYELGGLDSRFDRQLLYWVFSRGLEERFNAAVNTRVVAEYRELMKVTQSGARLKKFKISATSLQGATARGNSSIFRTIQALIRRNTPLDYPDGLVSVPMSLDKAAPISLIEKTSPTNGDFVLGIVLGTHRTTNILHNRSLSFIRSDLQDIDVDRSISFISSQLLPPLSSSAWESDSKFIHERASIIIELIDAMYRDSVTPHTRAIDASGRSDDLEVVRRWLHENPEATAPYGEALEDETLDLLTSSNFQTLRRTTPDIMSELRKLVKSQKRLSRAERLSVMLLYARALDSVGRHLEAIHELQIADRDAGGSDMDPELQRLKPMIASELGRVLVDSGRVDEGVIALADALGFASAAGAPMHLQVSILLEYARGLARLGERTLATSIAKDLVENGVFGLGEQFPELAAAARHLLDGLETH